MACVPPHVSKANVKTFQGFHSYKEHSVSPTSGKSFAQQSSASTCATHTRLLYCQHQQLGTAYVTAAPVCLL